MFQALLRAYPKIPNGIGKILANASTPDFSGALDIILGYALHVIKTLDAKRNFLIVSRKNSWRSR
jgi:hypothetical protein